MGLNKYNGKLEDISNWSVEKIVAKIREIEKERQMEIAECFRYIMFKNEQLEYLLAGLEKKAEEE